MFTGCENLEALYVDDNTYALTYARQHNLPYIIYNFQFGDVNRDGKVNGIDAGLLLQHLAEWDVNMDFDAADVNCDGSINGIDISLLLQYLADWEVKLGKI